MGRTVGAELTLRPYGLNRVVGLLKLSCWAPGAEALWADLPELN